MERKIEKIDPWSAKGRKKVPGPAPDGRWPGELNMLIYTENDTESYKNFQNINL